MSVAYESNQAPGQAENTVAIEEVKGTLVKKFSELQDAMDKAMGQAKDAGSVAQDVKTEVTKLGEDYVELFDRVQELEQKGLDMSANDGIITIGDEFVKSDQFKDYMGGRQGKAKVEFTKAIINATGQNQPLVPAHRVPGIQHEPNRRLTVRDILSVIPTSENLIEYAKENVFTNNAGPQVGGSPEQFENVTKPESNITFTQATKEVRTLAHWIAVSKQIMADAPQLAGYINSRLMYGLKLVEENQLLTGTGANGNLHGLIPQATAWANESPNITNEIDIVRSAIKQAELSFYNPTHIILNPQDWYDIDIRKVGTGDDRYVIGDPAATTTPRLWGLPVIVTAAMTSGSFLMGSFDMGATIFDREQASIMVSTENSDNFVKNMVTVLCEERLALVVFRPAAFITGAL